MLENTFDKTARQSLSEASFTLGLQVLADRDRTLASILETLGNPRRWQREPGFATLIQLILEQQVSLAAAKAVFKRLTQAVNPLTPENFLTLKDDELKAIGFSRQKTRYGRALADAITSGKLNLEQIAQLDNTSIRTQLIQIKGIGDWTVDNYLLMALQRQDVFPKGDLALAIAVQKIKGLKTRPKPKELETIALYWRPWRSIAARILWHYYLNQNKS